MLKDVALEAMEQDILMRVNLLLEDVAEDPTRLVRAQELARQQIKGCVEAYAKR